MSPEVVLTLAAVPSWLNLLLTIAVLLALIWAVHEFRAMTHEVVECFKFWKKAYGMPARSTYPPEKYQ